MRKKKRKLSFWPLIITPVEEPFEGGPVVPRVVSDRFHGGRAVFRHPPETVFLPNSEHLKILKASIDSLKNKCQDGDNE